MQQNADIYTKMLDKGLKMENKRDYETWNIQCEDPIYISHLRELGREIISIDMVENSPEPMKDTNHQIQKTQEF